MADLTTTPTQASVIQVSLPGAGETASYQMTSDSMVKFTFDISQAEFIGNGNNLEIVLEGGGKIILMDYLLYAGSDNPPTFELVDGEMIPGSVYLFAFEGTEAPGTEEELETAADAGASGSGAGEYTDDPGSLGDGIDALGGQGDAFDGHAFDSVDPVAGDVIEPEPIPPVAIDDVNVVVEDGWNNDEEFNGNYQDQNQLGLAEGNLLLNDFDDDNIDYPETSGAETELVINSIDFPGADFTGNDPGAVEVTDAGVQVNGLYGTLTVFADGTYSYVLDENLADPLRGGQEVEEVFDYTAIDPQGNVSNTAQLTITVVGTNDAPEAVNDVPVEDVIEQGTVVPGVASVSGNVLHNDSDIDNVGYEDLDPSYADLVPTDPDGLIELGVTSIYSYETYQYADTPENGVFTVDGQYGTLTISVDGSYEYVLDQDKADPLNIGDDPFETFSYSMWDGEKFDYALLNIPIHGSNDAPVGVVDVNELTEAVDEADAGHVAGNVLANDTDVDNVDFGDLGVIQLTVNDAEYSGGGTPPARVSNEYPDADHVIEGEWGTLYLFEDGSYHYIEDKDATDPLNSDDPDVTDVFTYEVTDNQAGGALSDLATLTITISGANDTPVATVDTNAFTESVDELGPADIFGNILANDTDIDNVDAGDLGVSELSITDIDYTGGGTPPARVSDAYPDADHVVEGEWGTLYLWDDGSYHFVEDKNATDPLNSDDPDVTDVFTYEVSDNQAGGALTDTATLTITISGANDSPVATLDTNAFTESVDDNGPADVSGNVLANDTDIDNVDIGDPGLSELTINDIDYTGGGTPPARVSDEYPGADHVVEGEWGTLYLWNDGSYHYVEDKNATDPLNIDDPDVTDVFTYEVIDNQPGGALTDTATLTITISGADDSPQAHVDTNAFTESVDELGPADVFGNVLANDTDIDNVDPGDLGTSELVISDIDYTGGGTPPARVSDAYPDADHVVEGEWGTLYLWDDGSYHFVEDKNATDPLNSDDPDVTDVFTYEVTDNQPGGSLNDTATLTITISGANDSPVATIDTNAFTESVDELGPADVSGNVLANDTDIDNVDIGDPGLPELSISDIDYTGGGTPPARVSDAYPDADHVVEGEWGTLYLWDDGSYHFVEDKNATDPLNSDDPDVTDVFTYEVTDNQAGGALTDTATLTITISGANDSPVATVDTNAFTESVDELGPADVFGNVLANDTDIDNIDPGEVGTSELSISDIDYTGGGTPPARVSDAYPDADHVVEGEWGTLYLWDDGSYHFVEDKNATDPLNSDDPDVTDVFTYEVTDNQPGGSLNDTATLTITISGANDSPVATVDTNAFTESVDELGPADVFGNVLANDTDIDNIDPGEVGTSELSISDIDYTGGGTPPARVSDAYPDADHVVEGEWGTLYLWDDGSYHFVEDKNATDPLNSDDPDVTDVFTYEVTDNQAGGALTDTATLTITISGANDSPVATVDTNAFTESVDELGPADVFGNVLANDTDIDNIDPGEVGTSELSISDIDYTGGGTPPARVSDAYPDADHVVEGEWGTLYLWDDGSYHYVEDKNATDPLNNDDPDVTDVFTYEVTDNQAGGALTDTATLTLTISGANDSPVATLDTNSFTESVDDLGPGDVFGNVLANDTDIDNVDLGDIGTPELTVDSVSYTGGGTPPSRTSTDYPDADHVLEGEWGTLYLWEDGTYHYVEDKDATDPLNIGDPAVSDEFTYVVTDNQAGDAKTASTTLTITIDPANDTPVAVHDGSHEIFIENTVVTIIDDWSMVSGNVYEGPGYTMTAEAFDSNDDPVSDVAFTTWGNDQHLGIYTNGDADDQKVDDLDWQEQITFEFDDPQSSFSIEFVAHGANHVNAWVYPVGSDTPTLFTNVGNSVYITPGFEFDTIVFKPDGAFGMESLTTVTGGDNTLTGVAEGNVLANDYDVDNVTFDDAVAAGDMGLLEHNVSDIDSANAPGNAASTGSDIGGDYFTVDGEFGSLKIYETGEWSYDPYEGVPDDDGNYTSGWQSLDESATDVFEYTLSDGSGGTDTAFIEVSLNVNTGEVTGGTGSVLGTASHDVIFPESGDEVMSGAGSDSIVIDPEYMGSGPSSVDILDFSDSDHLTLGNLEGANVTITSDSNDVNLVFTDIDGSDDIVVNLLGVNPVDNAFSDTVEITTSDDLNQLIQTIIDSGNDSIL